MWLIFVAVVLGIVEGITEFIPVSSTGHLIIAGHILGFTGKAANCFEIIIQLGAILSVVILYWDRFAGLFMFKTAEGAPVSGFRGVQEWVLLFLTTLPALIFGAGFHHFMKEHLFKPTPVVLALAIGAIGIILAEKFKPQANTESLDGLTWRQALFIGLFQCFSLWPGMSRAAATIVGGMLCRLDRKVAAEYSFLAAVPVMFAATAFELFKSRGDLCREDIPIMTVGFIVSLIVAGFAVKTFIKLLQRWTLVPFAIYRLAFAAVFAILAISKIITLSAD